MIFGMAMTGGGSTPGERNSPAAKQVAQSFLFPGPVILVSASVKVPPTLGEGLPPPQLLLPGMSLPDAT